VPIPLAAFLLRRLDSICASRKLRRLSPSPAQRCTDRLTAERFELAAPNPNPPFFFPNRRALTACRSDFRSLRRLGLGPALLRKGADGWRGRKGAARPRRPTRPQYRRVCAPRGTALDATASRPPGHVRRGAFVHVRLACAALSSPSADSPRLQGVPVEA